MRRCIVILKLIINRLVWFTWINPKFNGSNVQICENNINCMYKDCIVDICPAKYENYQYQICIDIHHIKLILGIIIILFVLVVIRKIHVSYLLVDLKKT